MSAAAKSLQSCLTLCGPVDGSPLGSPVPGILQARTLEWVAISFSNAWKWKVKVKSCPTLRDPMDCSLPGSSIHGIFQAGVLKWGAITFSDLMSKCTIKGLLFTVLSDKEVLWVLWEHTGNVTGRTGTVLLRKTHRSCHLRGWRWRWSEPFSKDQRSALHGTRQWLLGPSKFNGSQVKVMFFLAFGFLTNC